MGLLKTNLNFYFLQTEKHFVTGSFYGIFNQCFPFIGPANAVHAAYNNVTRPPSTHTCPQGHLSPCSGI